MVAQGFSNFTAVAVDGTKTAATDLGTSGSASNVTSAASGSSAAFVGSSAANVAPSAPVACGATTLVTVTRAVSFTNIDLENVN
jgi:hypothetical protein